MGFRSDTIEKKRFEFNDTFAAVMASDNPFTPQEIRRMIDKHRDMYGHLEKWAAPKEK